MEEGLITLQQGKVTPTLWESRFLIQWPEHLGGGEVVMFMEGSMILVPELGVR